MNDLFHTWKLPLRYLQCPECNTVNEWVHQIEAAAYLDVSVKELTALAKKYNLFKTKIDNEIHYRVSTVEHLANIMKAEKRSHD
jgi:hypothetical protein